MFDIVKKFFDKAGNTGADRNNATKIHDVRVASCALLLEMARIDERFTPEEAQTLISILKSSYGLSREDADALVDEADKQLDDSVDYWRFARLINENYTIAEKIEIIEMLWRIIFVDGKMDRHEHYLINKLSDLLRLTHKQMIDAKLKILRENEA